MAKFSKIAHGMNVGSMVEDINPTCPHHGAKGKVVKSYPNEVTFIVINRGKNHKPGDLLTKTISQMVKTGEVSEESKRFTEAGLLRQTDMKPDSTKYLYSVDNIKPLKEYIPNNPFTGNPLIDDKSIYEIGDLIQKGKIKNKSDLASYTSLGYLMPDNLFHSIKDDTLKTKYLHEKDEHEKYQKELKAEEIRKAIENEKIDLSEPEEKTGQFFKVSRSQSTKKKKPKYSTYRHKHKKSKLEEKLDDMVM